MTNVTEENSRLYTHVTVSCPKCRTDITHTYSDNTCAMSPGWECEDCGIAIHDRVRLSDALKVIDASIAAARALLVEAKNFAVYGPAYIAELNDAVEKYVEQLNFVRYTMEKNTDNEA